MSPDKLLGLAAFCLFLPSIGTSTTDATIAAMPSETPARDEGSTVSRTTVARTTIKTTTMDPREAARQAALELSREIFRNITKQLRDSIAAKDFSVFTTTPVNQDDQDDLHPFRHQPKHHHEHHWGPYFDEPLNGASALQVRTHLASEATLNCRVGMLRDKTVMWLRKTADKVHLLTVGATTYSGDSRIAVKFQYPNNWRLSINPVQRDDAGLYMCQVSTHPPRVLLTNVTVLAPILKIVDEQGHEVRDRYYKAGSAIELSCRVSRAYTGTLNAATTSTPPPIFNKPVATPPTTAATVAVTTTETPAVVTNSSLANATRADSAIKPSSNNSLPKDGVDSAAENNNVLGITWHKDGKVLTEKVTAKNMSSTFKLLHADQKDSGAYACSILNASTVTVQVQVLSGETQAAVHHDTLNGAVPVVNTPLSLLFCVIVLVTRFSGLN